MLTGKPPFDDLQDEDYIMEEVGHNNLKPTDGRDFKSNGAHCFLDQCFKRYGSNQPLPAIVFI